ncbi:hypothetical protein FACS1894201_07690 [Bacteroidia bacterium]|nr:hypothetical protein FACS1894201_07690 [Bacteroidia bacterium]
MVCGISQVFAQQFESQITVQYDMYRMTMTFPYYSATLEYNNSQALFTYINQGDSPTSKIKSKVSKGSDYGNITVTISKDVKKLYLNRQNQLVLIYTDNDKSEKVVVDSIQQIKWKYLTDSTKTVAGYTCSMAEAAFRGNVYTVWYAPEIKSSFGPWKLNGCPGLILEATRDDKILSFYATKLSVEKNSVIASLEDRETQTYQEYRQDIINRANANIERDVANRPRGYTTVHYYYLDYLENDFWDGIKRDPYVSLRKKVSQDLKIDEDIEM